MATTKEIEDWLSSPRFWASLNGVPEWRHILDKCEDPADLSLPTLEQQSLVRAIANNLEESFGGIGSLEKVSIDDIQRVWYTREMNAPFEVIAETDKHFREILESESDERLKDFVRGYREMQAERIAKKLAGQKMSRYPRLF